MDWVAGGLGSTCVDFIALYRPLPTEIPSKKFAENGVDKNGPGTFGAVSLFRVLVGKARKFPVRKAIGGVAQPLACTGKYNNLDWSIRLVWRFSWPKSVLTRQKHTWLDC